MLVGGVVLLVFNFCNPQMMRVYVYNMFIDFLLVVDGGEREREVLFLFYPCFFKLFENHV